ncbi:MAG: ATP-binding protein [Veillonellaceae bacterium]|nr:ATP-binding protein [Veillonellaceae bacterium]
MAEVSEVDWQAMLDRFRKYAQEAPPGPADSDPDPGPPTGGASSNTDCDGARLEACGVFARYHGATFENIEDRGVPAELRGQVDAVRGYADAIDDNIRQGCGLLLRGPVGTLKTTLAVAVLQCWLRRGGSARFLTMPSLVDNIFAAKAVSPDEWNQFEIRLRQTPLLVLDDLGAEWSSGWPLTKVDAIIAERYNRRRSTIITTNLGSAALRSRYSDRMVDRLRGTCRIITFNTPASLRRSPLASDAS